jgi:2-succinyl-5-enolpyruvyl-6-hydroxy-3-cyclohexene-1-carboxylate synthase
VNQSRRCCWGGRPLCLQKSRDWHPQAPKGDEEFYRLVEQAEEVLNQADAVVVSGSAFAHRSLDQLLGFWQAARQVIVFQ